MGACPTKKTNLIPSDLISTHTSSGDLQDDVLASNFPRFADPQFDATSAILSLGRTHVEPKLHSVEALPCPRFLDFRDSCVGFAVSGQLHSYRRGTHVTVFARPKTGDFCSRELDVKIFLGISWLLPPLRWVTSIHHNSPEKLSAGTGGSHRTTLPPCRPSLPFLHTHQHTYCTKEQNLGPTAGATAVLWYPAILLPGALVSPGLLASPSRFRAPCGLRVLSVVLLRI